MARQPRVRVRTGVGGICPVLTGCYAREPPLRRGTAPPPRRIGSTRSSKLHEAFPPLFPNQDYLPTKENLCKKAQRLAREEQDRRYRRHPREKTGCKGQQWTSESQIDKTKPYDSPVGAGGSPRTCEGHRRERERAKQDALATGHLRAHARVWRPDTDAVDHVDGGCGCGDGPELRDESWIPLEDLLPIP